MTAPSQESQTFPRKLVAVLCIDTVNYCRWMAASDEQTHIAVEASIVVFRRLVDSFDGRVLETTGDGLIAHFESAVRAVESAVAIQREVPQSDATRLDNGRLEFRIGIALGDVAFDTDRIFGSALNLASRVEEYSPPGELCVTRSVYEQVRSRLPLGFDSLGAHDIKGFEDPVELFRVRPEGAGASKAARIRESPRPFRLPERPSIAVLRFDFIGTRSQGESQLFGFGVSEDITTRLSRYKSLFVIARNSAFAFHGSGTSVPDIASALGVRYVVEGSVRTSGNRVRITAQLIDAAAGYHLWADTYDRDLSDVFEVQDEVSTVIVSTIAGRLTDAERARSRKLEPMELEAYGWLLKGQDAFQRYTREGNELAQQCFAKAIDLNPDYARAHAALSRTHHYEWQFGWGGDPDTALQHALEYAVRAVNLDAEDPRGYAERGFVYLFMKELDLAISELKRAHEMNPNDADVMVELGDALHYDGQLEEAVQCVKGAMRLNPYYPDFYLWYLADSLYHLARYEETISAILQMHNLNVGRRLLAASYAHLGRIEMARSQAEEVQRLQSDFSISAYLAKQPYANSVHIEHLSEGLRKAGLSD